MASKCAPAVSRSETVCCKSCSFCSVWRNCVRRSFRRGAGDFVRFGGAVDCDAFLLDMPITEPIQNEGSTGTAVYYRLTLFYFVKTITYSGNNIKTGVWRT